MRHEVIFKNRDTSGQNTESRPSSLPKRKIIRNEDLTPLWHARSRFRVHRLTATALFPILCGHLYLTIKNLLIWLGMLAIAGLKNLNPASVLKRRPKGVE